MIALMEQGRVLTHMSSAAATDFVMSRPLRPQFTSSMVTNSSWLRAVAAIRSLNPLILREWAMAMAANRETFDKMLPGGDHEATTNTGGAILHMQRVIVQPALRDLAAKYGHERSADYAGMGVNAGRSVTPKSSSDWQNRENVESDFALNHAGIEIIETLNIKARFNDLGLDYQYRLNSDLKVTAGTGDGKTH